LIFNTYYGWKAEHVLKLNKEFKGKVNRADIKSVSSKGFGYLLSPIWQSVFFQGTTFVVRLSLGPAAVTIFNTVRTVSRSANQAYGMVNLTVFPELQFEIGAGRMAKARQLFRMAMGSVMVIAALGMLFLFIGGPWIYHIWTKGKLQPPSAMWNIFILGIGLNALWWTAGMIFRAVNQPYRLAISGFIASVISIVLSYFLSLKLGLTGAAIGSLVLDAFMAFYVLPITCKLLGQELKTLPADIVNDIKEVYHKFKKKAVTQEA
jgi:O-antigen/teichoic acid export membrane protein